MASLIPIDTACALFEIGGVRLLTDPVFDPPGARYHFGWGTLSRKSSTPALSPDQVGSSDAILLSHDPHGDNLDRAGRKLAEMAPRSISTTACRKRKATGVHLWEAIKIEPAGSDTVHRASDPRAAPPALDP